MAGAAGIGQGEPQAGAPAARARVIGMPPVVGDVMASAVTRVDPQTPLSTVMRLLRERAVTAVPVVDQSDQVVGIVSAMDLVGEPARNRGPTRLLRWRAGRSGALATAADRMSRPVVSVAPQTPLRTAARLLQLHDIHHLPVIDGGKLVGMVTRRDLLAAFLRGDEQIRRQLAHAAQITFNATPDQVAVTVHSGVVQLEGQVGLRSIARELERLAMATDGVVGLDSRLHWDLDDLDSDDVRPSG